MVDDNGLTPLSELLRSHSADDESADTVPLSRLDSRLAANWRGPSLGWWGFLVAGVAFEGHSGEDRVSCRDTGGVDSMDFSFDGPVVEWRGPAPFYFLAIPQDDSADIKFAAKGMEYWGQVPVRVRIKSTEFTTALFPKDGRYLLPLKDVVRKSAGIEVGQVVTVAMSVGRP
jgi:hypothetical protein